MSDETGLSGDDVPADLSHAGAIVDKAIEYMLGQDISALSVASALLGGALGVLGRSLDDGSIVKILDNAIAGVRAGELQRLGGAGPGRGSA